MLNRRQRRDMERACLGDYELFPASHLGRYATCAARLCGGAVALAVKVELLLVGHAMFSFARFMNSKLIGISRRGSVLCVHLIGATMDISTQKKSVF
jgi:hypothetical protein